VQAAQGEKIPTCAARDSKPGLIIPTTWQALPRIYAKTDHSSVRSANRYFLQGTRPRNSSHRAKARRPGIKEDRGLRELMHSKRGTDDLNGTAAK